MKEIVKQEPVMGKVIVNIDQELKLLEKIVDVWNYYSSLPIQHPNEKNEFAAGIHILQHIAGMRILRKEHPEIFPIKYIEEDV